MNISLVRRVTATLAASLMSLTLAACGGDSDDALPRVDLFVGTQPFGTIFVAEDRGLFKEEGVDVRVNRFASGTEATEAFRAAKAGLFVAGDMPSLLAWENGDVVGIAPISSDVTTFSLVTGKGIATAADLRGKKLATVSGSTGDIFIRSYLTKNKIALDDVEILNLGPGDMAAALVRGDIDGFAWLGGEVSKGAEGAADAKILQQGTEGYVVNHIILSATKNLMKDSASVDAVLRALQKAQQIVNDDPDAAVASIVKVTGMDESTARADLERIDYDMVYTNDFVTEMKDVIGLSLDAGFIKAAIDLADVFDSGPLGRVDSSLIEGAAK